MNFGVPQDFNQFPTFKNKDILEFMNNQNNKQGSQVIVYNISHAFLLTMEILGTVDVVKHHLNVLFVAYVRWLVGVFLFKAYADGILHCGMTSVFVSRFFL